MSAVRHQRRVEIAERGATKLHQAERAIDETLEMIGAFCAELPRMRQEADLSALVGNDVFVGLGQAYAAATEVRSRLVDVHESLDRVRLQLKLPATHLSSGADKPPPSSGSVVLQAVA